MAGPRQPIELIVANGKKHISKADVAARRASEVQPCTDNIEAPAYLTAAQRKRFDTLAAQLLKIKIMGETDTETLARYVTAQELYEQAVKDLRAIRKQRLKDADAVELLEWAALLDKLDKRQDRYFKQAHTAATALGLTISSRCRLVVPAKEEEKPQNKFARFGQAAGGEAYD
jgi:P27 family predicted phage terminase small subunit